MPRALRITLITAALALAPLAHVAAAKSVDSNHLLYVQQGSAEALVLSLNETPLRFHSTAAQAIAAAERSPVLRALHKRMHPLSVIPYVYRAINPYWYVVFLYRGKIVADANVTSGGKLTGAWTGLQAAAPYTHGNVSWSLSGWMVLLPGALLFLLPFLDPRRLRRMAHLDALAVLSLLVSYLLLAGAHLEPAVWSVYPPLVYLLVRLMMVGFRGPTSAGGRLAPLLSTRTLLIALPLLLAARLVVSFLGHQEIDVGYESVIGASRILNHLPIYWNDVNHGDTYGPVTYLAYVPFDLLFTYKQSLNTLHAADAAAIFFDLGTIAGLFILGRRLRAGAEGTRLGLVLAWAWAACPFTTIALVAHTNDGLIAMLTVFALIAIASPVVSGAILGLAAAAKFSPAALLPLLAAPRERGRRGALLCAGTFIAVVAVAIYSWLPPGGLSYFWHRTLGFQLHRFDVFSPWALHPALHPLQTAIEVLAVLLVALVAFIPRKRSLGQVCALAGAVTIAVQLPAQHWFYYYIVWFLPFALVAFLAPMVRTPGAGPSDTQAEPAASRRPDRRPVLAGA